MDLLDPIDKEQSIDTTPNFTEVPDSAPAPKPDFHLGSHREQNWMEDFVATFSRAAGPAAFVTAVALAARFVLI